MSERFVWREGEVVVFDSQCDICSHRREGDTCEAFPGGIPAEILSNEHDHREPYPGDGGYRYELRSEEAPSA